MSEVKYTPNTPTEAIVSHTLQAMAGNAISNKRGYSYINGSLMPNALSPALSRAMRVGRIVRPGQAVSEEFIAAVDPKNTLNVTAQIQTNTGLHIRSLRNNGEGTPGNDGLVNMQPKITPSTTPFNIPVAQLSDRPFFFPQMQLETMMFDEVVETVANQFDNVDNGIDTYHMAKAVSYACWRGGKMATKNANILTYKAANAYNENEMIKLLNLLTSRLSNGDKETQLMTFTGRRTLVARPEFVGYLQTPKTGYISNNSDIGQRMVLEPNFDTELALRVGSQYRGSIKGYDLYEANDQIFGYVEQWLGLAAGALSGLSAICFTPLAYASGGVAKKEMKMLQSTDHDGVVAFPFVKFGGTAYRLMYMIAEETWSVPEDLNASAPKGVVAPFDWLNGDYEDVNDVVYDADGNPSGYKTFTQVLKPNGDGGKCQLNMTVTGTSGAKVNNALVAVTVGSELMPVSNNANGTYTSFVIQKSAPTITVTASGYAAKTVTLTAANTKNREYKATIQLTT